MDAVCSVATDRSELCLSKYSHIGDGCRRVAQACQQAEFGALHCECGHSDLADGLPAVLAELEPDWVFGSTGSALDLHSFSVK